MNIDILREALDCVRLDENRTKEMINEIISKGHKRQAGKNTTKT